MAFSLDERRDLCGDGKVTLNGKPARIVGAMCEFAKVYADGDQPAYEFAWETVARAIAEKRDLKA